MDFILVEYPNVKGILFELPEVIANMTTTSFTQVSGNFFETIPINADIFILKRILHDWDDEKAIQILKNVSNSMSQSSCLYIIDGILDHAKNKQLLAAIDLALLAIFQGKERTLREIQTLLNKTNLKLIDIIPINDLISAIQCKKI